MAATFVVNVRGPSSTDPSEKALIGPARQALAEANLSDLSYDDAGQLVVRLEVVANSTDEAVSAALATVSRVLADRGLRFGLVADTIA